MRTLITIAATFLAIHSPSPAQPDRETRIQWWREARFGMFVHWGLYSGLAGTWDGKPAPCDHNLEHIQRVVGADTHTYAARAIPKFQPKPDFAVRWAQLAKAAGCRYVVFTTKHHDGFALHDSKLTQFDAGDVLNRDLVREITDALRAEGLRVGFYHSLIDWHHPQYDYTKAKYPPYPEGGKSMTIGPRDHNRYIDYLHGQVDELLSNYGKIDIMWWDYSSFGFDGDDAWKAGELIALCHRKQPGIIMNNRLFRRPEAGFSPDGGADLNQPLAHKFGDFGTPEKYLPDGNLATMDWEACMTMNETWGYSEHDQNWKSSTTLIRQLIDAASKGGNYLLNIGPMADGSIPQPSIDIMTDIGKWMKVNGEAIHGSRPVISAAAEFDGCTTRSDRATYLILFSRPESGKISINGSYIDAPTKATLLDGNQALTITHHNGQMIGIELPATLPDPIATVIRLD